ncbi:sensor histidine kinase [Ancylobacter sp. TS-1]|uniref:sensor histidine kinase n=1 Tax=Ancylobacter sp. TS-1 TaxID=1850374 RepID=UPI001FED9905|nr:HAMP domain-containing sensor histidine kinase [Ancylobacter sp. TS-1]
MKVPLAVAALMVLVGVVLSERVLSRLDQSQERHLRELAQSYLDGLSSAIAPSILRDDVWEVFDAIERAQQLNKSLRPAETIVANADDRVIAASDPRLHPVGKAVATSIVDATGQGTFRFDSGADQAYAQRELSYPGRKVGTIYASFDTRHLAIERRGVLTTLVLTNGFLTLLLAAAGWLLVARMMRPIRILSDHLGSARETDVAPIAPEIVAASQGEFGRLFQAYNALVQSTAERQELSKRLAEEERLGSLGRLASALAHEINNPLGGLFNALATVKSHGHIESVRVGSVGLLERGLVGIRDVVRTTLALYRTDGSRRDLMATDIEDLGLLIAPEARRREVSVTIGNALEGSVPLPSTPMRQAILNLLLNAVAAAPAGSVVALSAASCGDGLVVEVRDCGPGLPLEAAALLTGTAGARPLRDGAGLGLWMTHRLLHELGATIAVAYPETAGTCVRVSIPFERDEEFAHVA